MKCVAENGAAETPTLTDLNALTDAVHAAISSGDWQEAARLESARREQLAAFLAAESARHGNVRHLGSALAAMQQRNQCLIGEVDHRRRSVVFEAAAVTQGRRAVNAYASVAGGASAPRASETQKKQIKQ